MFLNQFVIVLYLSITSQMDNIYYTTAGIYYTTLISNTRLADFVNGYRGKTGHYMLNE